MKRMIILLAINVSILLPAMERIQDTSKQDLFITATQKGMVDTMQHLKHEGVDPSVALHMTVRNGLVKSVSQLLAMGANPNALNKSNETPLVYMLKKFVAADYCDVDCCCCCGCHQNLKMADGTSYRYEVSPRVDEAEKIAQKLLESGASAQIGNPLAYAISIGWKKMVPLLIKHGASVHEVVYEDGRGALAASCGSWSRCDCCKSIVTTLLKAGAVIDHKDTNGETALFKACKYHNVSIMKMLVKAGANVHIKNNAGKSILETAVTHGNEGHVNLLKKYGASL